MSVVTVLPEACKNIKSNTTPTNSLKSMESIYTTTPTSSKFSVLSRRKINQKARDRNPTLVPAVSEIKQRVMSARMLRVKQLQNQIGEAHHRIAELSAENRLLKSLHKRQDSALSKYESSNAELPQLLHSHAEELRMWQTRCRNLQRQNKELQAKLKQKETILLTITDQNKQLLQLNKDKNLQERASLQERVKVLEQRCMDKENEIRLFARRLQLECKAFKTNLNMEQQKYRDLVSKIESSDFFTIQDKKSYPKSKSLYNKSPLNRLTSKSAVNISHINGDKEYPNDTVTTILPPCNDSKRNDDHAKQQNSPSLNGNNVVKFAANYDHDHLDEIDLSKNCIDNSDNVCKNVTNVANDNDEAPVRIKNGMLRARHQQQNNLTSTKTNPKLSPLHTDQQSKTIDNKSEKKSICNDSELSEDDVDDFQYFSNHNGTKTTHARELLDHKMHINELEEKMKLNTLDDNKSNTINAHQCSESYKLKTPISSSLSSHEDLTLRNDEMTHYTFNAINDRGDNNDLISIQRELHDSTLHRESILDEYCEIIIDDDKNSNYSEHANARAKKIEFASRGAQSSSSGSFSTKNQSPYQANNYVKSNGIATAGAATSPARKEGIGKPTKLDEKKKTRLLAILKNLDSNGLEI